MAKIRESEEHSKSKMIEHFLAGFKVEGHLNPGLFNPKL